MAEIARKEAEKLAEEESERVAAMEAERLAAEKKAQDNLKLLAEQKAKAEQERLEKEQEEIEEKKQQVKGCNFFFNDSYCVKTFIIGPTKKTSGSCIQKEGSGIKRPREFKQITSTK